MASASPALDPYAEHATPYPGSFLPPEAQSEMFNQHFQTGE